MAGRESLLGALKTDELFPPPDDLTPRSWGDGRRSGQCHGGLGGEVNRTASTEATDGLINVSHKKIRIVLSTKVVRTENYRTFGEERKILYMKETQATNTLTPMVIPSSLLQAVLENDPRALELARGAGGKRPTCLASSRFSCVSFGSAAIATTSLPTPLSFR